jgi:hypothetical protein
MSNRDASIEAAKALSQLYVLGAITDILEGGSGNGLRCGSRINKICQKERIKLLGEYDKLIGGIKQ